VESLAAILAWEVLMNRRLTRVTGLAFAVVILVSEVLKGDSPSPTGPAAEIVSFFADHRSTILAGAYVQMLALFLLALLFATLPDDVMPVDAVAGRLARLGLALTLTAYTTYVLFTAALAFGAATDTTPETAKSLWEIRFVSDTFINFPVALLIGSVAFAVRPGLTRSWYRWGSLAIAAMFPVGGAALARNGFFAPDGGYGFILFWLLPLWVALTAFAATPRRNALLSPAHTTG
jgi:hypothetical protein